MRTNSPPRSIYLLPNAITTAGLFCGFYAIVGAMSGHFEKASIAIFIAMLLDGLDGRVARLTNTQSEFGEQFDSLADLVSFGVAPSILMFQWSLFSMVEHSQAVGRIGWMAAFIYIACAAFRLARFNINTNVVDKRHFVGLPSPASAAVIAGFIWAAHNLDLNGANLQWPATILIILCGILMVSNVRYYSFKDFNFRQKIPHIAFVVIFVIIALIMIDPAKVLFMVFFAYAMSGLVQFVFRLRKYFSRKNKSQ